MNFDTKCDIGKVKPVDMPTPCKECGERCEFDYMQSIGHELYCDECFEEMKEWDEE